MCSHAVLEVYILLFLNFPIVLTPIFILYFLQPQIESGDKSKFSYSYHLPSLDFSFMCYIS